MTLSDFQALNDAAKANAVWNGTYVSTRVVDDVYIQLYDLGGLYVDVRYDLLVNKVINITPNFSYRTESYTKQVKL